MNRPPKHRGRRASRLVLCAAALLLTAPKGDVAIDGAVDVRDVHLLQRAIRGLTTLSPEQQDNADVAPIAVTGTPGDGVVDTGDVAVLRQAVGFRDPDGDDLGQEYEELLGLSPFVRDSDGNGIPDGQEDPDGDGLSNRAEQAFGQDPLSPDTDGDGILDGRDAPAPALPITEVTRMKEATAYLYTGIDPMQAGVPANTIDATRAAVIRGVVRDASGAPIPGVAISVAGQPQYGTTHTLLDGHFDLVVNGGSVFTLAYESDAHLRMWRRVETPVLDYVVAPDVTLQSIDLAGTGTVALSASSTTASHWRGSTITDARGTRRPTMIFQPGTTAAIDGSPPVPLPSVTVQATEGTRNWTPDAIPSTPLDISGGHDPVWVGDFTVQEASADSQIEFANVTYGNKPVVFYYENFVDYDVGTVVGNANLDTSRVAWTETGNSPGRVVKIIDIDGGIASVDTDGDGAADNVDLSDAEREELGSLYSAGQELFRFPIKHFSSICTHRGFAWPLDARVPDVPVPQPQAPDDCTPECGSLIDVESQVLREAVAVAGTPWRLHYTSERTPGYLATYRVRIPVTGATIPDSLARAQLKVEIAGKRTSYPAFEHGQNLAPNLSQLVTWSGTDPYERRPQGRQPVRAWIEWTYPWRGFLNPDGTPMPNALAVGAGIRRREWTGHLGPWDNRAHGLGGWSLSAVHAYDARTRILYRGDGERVSADSLPEIVKRLNKSALPNHALHIAVGPDQRVYVALTNLSAEVGRIEADGTYTKIAGGGATLGDGGPAIQARLNHPEGLAFTPDGSLLIADRGHRRIRKIQSPVSPSSIISTVAGNGTSDAWNPETHEGTEATTVPLLSPEAVVSAPDGSFLIANNNGVNRVHRVSPDGMIQTIAGKGNPGGSENFCQGRSENPELPERALDAQIGVPRDVELEPDGSILIASSTCQRIYRVTSDGWLDSIAGGGTVLGDGGPAAQALLHSPYSAVAAGDGNIYVGAVQNTANSHRVRRIGTDGIITTIMGDGVSGAIGEGGPAAAARVEHAHGLALDALDRVHVSDLNHRVIRIEPPLPGFAAGSQFVPSGDGHELYEFDARGRHLRTIDAVRNVTLLEFSHDDEHGLVAIDDGQGNVTTVERNAQGVATAIVGPFGDRTTLDIDTAGWLTSAVDPSGADHEFGYDPGTTSDGTGLLTSYTTPEEHSYAYTYDAEGLLTLDEDPAGGSKSLTRTDAAANETPGWEVAVETALGRETVYSVSEPGDGSRTRSATDPAGLVTTTTRTPAFVEVTSAPAGMVSTTEFAANPQLNFGFTAAYPSRQFIVPPLATPAFERTETRTADIHATTGVLTDAVRTTTLHPNASPRVSTITWDHDASVSWLPGVMGRRRTISFVATRILDEMLDARGRLLGSQLGTLHPVKLAYNARGRIESIVQGPGTGDRITSFAYDSTTGRLASITDPVSRTTSFDAYDAAGRVLAMTLPGGRTVGFAYDTNGNLTSLTPPGRPAHVFRYTAIDQEDEYEPPALAGIADPRTLYAYDLDRNLDLVTRPDGKTVDLAYETTTGRLDTITIAEGVYDYSYYPHTPAVSTDADGQLESITAPGGEAIALTWDGTLPLGTTWSGTVAGNVARSFDRDFRVATESVNGTHTIAFGYDADSLLTSAGDLSITRDPTHGLVTGTTLGSVTTTETPNAFAELDTDSASISGSPIYTNAYTQRDALGRITAKTETIQGVTTSYAYSYTPAGQLDVVTINGSPVRDYDYDANGNRTHVNASLVGVYDDQDRLTSYGGATYTYTAAGDLESKTAAGDTTNYAYDALGNLRTVTFQNGMRIEYVIDGQNRRVGKKVCAAPCTGGATAQLQQGFLYADQLRVVAELDGSNTVVSRFVYGTKAHVPDYVIKSSVVYRLLTDHLGSVRLVANADTGAVAQRIDYDEWGNVLADTSPGFQPFGFAGGLMDADTGLVRFGARDYDARIGRWTTKDPIRFAGLSLSLFAYALSDPTNFIDPNGLQPFDDSISARAKALAGRGRLKELKEFMGGRSEDFPPQTAQKLLRQCRGELDRRAKEAERAFRENQEFRRYIDREFKQDLRNKGPERNPNMSAEDWLDAFEEFFGP